MNRKLRDRSRSPHAAPATTAPRRAAHRKASRSMRNTNFPSRDSMYCARAKRSPPSRSAAAARSPRTAISRVIVLHSAGARSRASLACHVPAAGDATSANQKYGGPPYRSRDLAATLPSGAISESSPSSGFSATKRTRKGAPFHGAIGEGRTASSAASSQTPAEPSARASDRAKEAEKRTCDEQRCCPAEAANWRAGNNGVPLPLSQHSSLGKLWLNFSSPHLQQHEPFLVAERGAQTKTGYRETKPMAPVGPHCLNRFSSRNYRIFARAFWSDAKRPFHRAIMICSFFLFSVSPFLLGRLKR